MRMQLATWPEVEDYLKESTGIILPIGSTEQHGPNGFIGTDALTSEMISFEVGDRVGAMVAPTINVGMAQHHLGFPGSMTLLPSTLIAVVRDMINSLARHGFERFYFINGHGGNVNTVNAAFSEVYAESSLRTAASNRPALRCVMRNWYMGGKVGEISREEFGEDEGSHATPSEVALTYFGFPEDGARVSQAPIDPPRAPKGVIYDADDYRRNFPDGRIGSNPGRATAEIGERIFKAAVEDLVDDYRDFVDKA
ncbi:MAG: creatininase family protein [Rhodospirillaceae bacterium]|jgi:creatinine amidohydrolase|nr:creatininase family protein [Rhodospirillaceae bacterium]